METCDACGRKSQLLRTIESGQRLCGECAGELGDDDRAAVIPQGRLDARDAKAAAGEKRRASLVAYAARRGLNAVLDERRKSRAALNDALWEEARVTTTSEDLGAGISTFFGLAMTVASLLGVVAAIGEERSAVSPLLCAVIGALLLVLAALIRLRATVRASGTSRAWRRRIES